MSDSEQNFDALPEDVKSAFDSVDIKVTTIRIANARKLHVDQAGNLMDTIELVLLGILHPKEFTKRIEAVLGITSSDATTIARDVNEQIFMPIRESLKKIHQIREEESLLESHEAEHPGADEILSAIVNPESIPSRTTVVSSQNSSDLVADSGLAPRPLPAVRDIMPPAIRPDVLPTVVPVSAVVGAGLPKTMPTMVERKLTETVRLPKRETTITPPPSSPLIPDDHKERLNQDPYKEAI